MLRPLTPEDAPALTEIRRAPEVARWWGEPDAHPDDAEQENLVVELDGRVVGLVQLSEEQDPDYRHAGIDVYLDPAVHGRGLGTEVIRGVVRHLVADRGHHRVTIDPAAENAAAVACYRRAGFRAVGVMRQYERVPGTQRWRDGLLMELLASDLTEP